VLKRRKTVESQDAAFDEWKYDVITGWLEAIIELSNIAIQYPNRMPPKTVQNLATLIPMNFDSILALEMTCLIVLSSSGSVPIDGYRFGF